MNTTTLSAETFDQVVRGLGLTHEHDPSTGEVFVVIDGEQYRAELPPIAPPRHRDVCSYPTGDTGTCRACEDNAEWARSNHQPKHRAATTEVWPLRESGARRG